MHVTPEGTAVAIPPWTLPPQMTVQDAQPPLSQACIKVYPLQVCYWGECAKNCGAVRAFVRCSYA